MTTSYTDIKRLFEQRKNNPQYNTSYPLSPDDWAKYSTPGSLPFDDSKPIAIYIHIPFCKQICSFCEYTKMCVPKRQLQTNYLRAMMEDVERFALQYPQQKIYGFDIGGGTPTALDYDVFDILMKWYFNFIDNKSISFDFEPSIEGTFESLASDDWGKKKSKLIADVGIRRLSLGIQSTSADILNPLHRTTIPLSTMIKAIGDWHSMGISKINLDLMYGLPGQTVETVRKDINVICELNPEQVTVYEFRTNQLRNNYKINSENCYAQYCELFNGLTRLGYYGEFGRNTFSRDRKDCGLSSYLRHRMFDGWQYKGIGISAQSMSDFGVAYNLGKNQAIGLMMGEKWLIDNKYSYEARDYYRLPPHEIFSKFIAISGYSGGFSLSVARELYGNGFDKSFSLTIDFLIKEGLAKTTDTRFQLTESGFRHYVVILSLFYHNDSGV